MTLLSEGFAHEDVRLLRAKYAEPHRVYHDLDHCHSVYLYANEIRREQFLPAMRANPKPSVLYNAEMADSFFRYAAAFHDVVYDLESTQNEELSAQIWERSQTCKANKFLQNIAQAIRATGDHFNPAHDSESLEVQIFLDADLYELGSDPVLFDINSERIFAEFAHKYTYEEMLNGRISWLNSVLDKPRIYRVAVDREEPARANLQRSLTEMTDRRDKLNAGN